MEQWEIDLRAKLEKELPDGFYPININKFNGYGGKGFQIEFEVALIKAAKNYMVEDMIDETINNKEYTNLTKKQIKDFLKTLEDGKE